MPLRLMEHLNFQYFELISVSRQQALSFRPIFCGAGGWWSVGRDKDVGWDICTCTCLVYIAYQLSVAFRSSRSVSLNGIAN